MPVYFFTPEQTVALPVIGDDKLYPVKRIFCVGRNYADHAREMGVEVERNTPFFFTKPPSAIVKSGSEIGYPPATEDLHFEMELVVALGDAAFEATLDHARDCVFGYACGIDLTRRDLQSRFKQKSHPWDLAKGFENSAVIGPIKTGLAIDDLDDKAIQLELNGETRQKATLSDMIWRVEELIMHLSRYYHLEPGDLLFTGTPAGVGAVGPGDKLTGVIDGVGKISLAIRR